MVQVMGSDPVKKSGPAEAGPTAQMADSVDILASLLDHHRLRTVVAGRIDLARPWRLDGGGSSSDLVGVFVQAIGTSHVVVPGENEAVLSEGDVLIRLRQVGRGYMHDGSTPSVATRRMRLPGIGQEITPQPWRLTSEEPDSSFVCCMLELGDLPRDALLSRLPDLLHLRAADAGSQARAVADLMIAESAEPGAASARFISRLAEVLLIVMLREQAADLAGGPGLRALSDPVIAPVIRRIHADPSQRWTVASLASSCRMSRSAFAVRFLAVVGETPAAYLAAWRLTHAAQLLRTTDDTVAHVAQSVGYQSEAAFRKAFVASLGRTPSAYRRGDGPAPSGHSEWAHRAM